MNYLLAFVALLIAFAVLRLAVIVVGLALLITLLVSFVRRPGHTLIFISCMLVVGLAGAHTLAFIGVIGIIGVVAMVLGAWRKRPGPLLLTDGREHHSN